MPERSLLSRLLPSSLLSAASSSPRTSRAGLVAAFLGAALVVTACTEEFEGGAGCPLLCPQEQAPFVDTIISAIDFDTTLGPYPVLGVSPGALLASRGDTLETHVIVRFDNLPNTFSPNGQPVQEAISTVDSVVLRFFVDTTASRADGPFTVEVFNVDTTESDSSSVVMRSLFRPDRKLGEVVVPEGGITDSLSIPIPDEFLEEQIEISGRVRLGVRILNTANAQLRLGAIVNGEGAARLTFDPASDTTYQPLDVVPRTGFLGQELDDVLRLAYTVYTLTIRGSEPAPPGTLRVGGWPSQRAYLRFAVPRAIVDSSTVVRAELLLTQRPSFSANRGDSVSVQPFIGVSRSPITDLYLATALAANGALAGISQIRFVPQDSGQRAINIVNLVRGWSTLDSSVTRFVALRIDGEGSNGAEVRFHDLSAPAALRPRLRITYLPRTEFAIP